MNQSPENQNEKPLPSDEHDGDESDTMDEQNSDQSSSGEEEEYDSDDSEDIVNDVRDLVKRDKIEVLIEVVKSRTEQLRLHRQVEVYEYALDVLGAEKTKLQLDLALTTKMLLVMRNAMAEHRKQDEQLLEQINMTSDHIGGLDMKRVQLIKEIRQLASQFAEHKSKSEETVNGRLQEETNRSRQLQDQLDAVYVTNNELKQQLIETEVVRQKLTSALSERMKELVKLTDDLQEAQKRIEIEIQTNTKLQENVEMFLVEKTQLATEVVQLENRITEIEQDNANKQKQMERTSSSQLMALEQQKNAKLAELEQVWKTRFEEEMRKIDAKLTEAKAQSDQTGKQTATLNETIEKLRADLESSLKALEQEKEHGKELESKIGHMQTMLDDRSNEVAALNSKLNGEHKLVDEEKEKIEELNTKLKTLQEDTDKKVNDLETQLKKAHREVELNKEEKKRLETDMVKRVATVSAMESTIAKKDKEQIALQAKLAAADKVQSELKELRAQLDKQKSTIESLETQLKAKRQEEMRTNTENLDKQPSLQITSTPFRLSNLTDSLDIPSKRTRINDNDAMSGKSSVSNYTSFQQNVGRKRDNSRFFARKAPVQNNKTTPETKSFFNRSVKQTLDDDLISLASTINLDETVNISSGDSPVPLVKPFFRRQTEKK